jgi:aryl-alcohol dehydrogenase-like predicted oxidoreductase
MTFGDLADEMESVRLYHRCREAGVNFFDTVNTYSGGREEVG